MRNSLLQPDIQLCKDIVHNPCSCVDNVVNFLLGDSIRWCKDNMITSHAFDGTRPSQKGDGEFWLQTSLLHMVRNTSLG